MAEKYLIGDASQILKLSKDTLRYYDKLGIVSPKKDPINNYRYYTMDDLLALSYVIVFRDLEISLDEIKHLMKNNSLDAFADLLNKQHLLIENKLKKLLHLQAKVTQFQDSVLLAQTLLGEFELCYSPTLVYQPLQKEWDTAYCDHLARMDESEIIQHPVFSIQIPHHSLVNADAPLSYTYGISGIIPEHTNFDALAHYQLIHAKCCIHTVIRATEELFHSDFKLIMTYLSTHHLTIGGDLIARNIAFEHCDESPIDYYELWIPINNS